MLNTADWSHGFYGYEESHIDTYFADAIPATGHGTPVWKRGRRLLRLLKAMKGVDREISRAELALLNDHAAASAALAPIGSSVILAKDGHAANIEQPAAFNAALLEFAREL